MKIVLYCLCLLGLILPEIASAHVTVTPDQVGLASFQTFTVGVPNEKNIPVIGVRLLIPSGLNEITPTVKPGWKITTLPQSQAEQAEITEIDWTNGSIPPEQRDEFSFSAQVPASQGSLKWKAYQTYQDGTVVSWDQQPGATDNENSTPYSETKVVDDINQQASEKSKDLPLYVSILALVLAGISLTYKQRDPAS